MRPGPDEMLHFSEDPQLTHFTPHVAQTAEQQFAYVWAVDADRAPDYWFPRQCPRALAWTTEETADADRVAILGTAERVHVIEYDWLARMQSTRLYAYRFARADFAPIGDPPYAQVALHDVRPIGPAEPVGDLLAAHESAGIELRLVATLWPFVDRASASTVGFSGIRLANARPR